MSCLWPVALLAAAAAVRIGLELARDRWRKALVKPRALRAVALAALQHTLPLALLLSFILVPSISTRVFKTFLCDPIEYASGDVRRYLHADLTLSCDSDEYDEAQRTAFLTLCIWPVGVPVLYAVLLWASRHALSTGIPTPLSRAVAFLSADFQPTYFWWEPLEMTRKLSICGWVLLIEESSEQARLLVALLLSVTFLSVRLALRPFRRCGAASVEALSLLHCTKCALDKHALHAGMPTCLPPPFRAGSRTILYACSLISLLLLCIRAP